MRFSRRSLLKGAVAYGPLLTLPGFQTQTGEIPAWTDAGALELARNGVSQAAILLLADAAGPWERRAAEDLARYIEIMTGAALPIVGRLAQGAPAIIVGKAALEADPLLEPALARVKKPKPVVRADAILVKRKGRRLYVAGSNDESIYFAASWLLQHWGCRWYMPTAFGEHVPRHRTLSVGALDHLYAPPFEIRHYWLSWNADPTGAEEFQRRNFMSSASVPGAGQVLDTLTTDLTPAGGSHFNVPFADPRTAMHVAAKVEPDYASGRDISLAIADGTYRNDDARDRALITEYDKYMMRPSLTDAMLTFYNNVGRILRERHPTSPSLIGGLAYANVTLPPRIVRSIEPNIVMWLAPIDIDPNHPMDDVRSPPRLEYREMVKRWVQVTDGRLAIYDYDQSMLVWRDLPNPSHHIFARDAKMYRAAGILGFGTESRGAFATTFLNLFFRGQLMWNPDADVEALLSEFYRNFYGAAAKPMARYWGRIFEAWKSTIVTEHEYFIIPAIYTPPLVEALRQDLREAEALAGTAAGPDGELLSRRMRFTRLSFEIIANYTSMVRSGATNGEYTEAAQAGDKALAARLALAQLNPIFTTRVVDPAAETEASGPAWFPGEVAQMRRFASLTDGSQGTLIKRLPLIWSFHSAEPLPTSWTYQGPQGPNGSWNTSYARQQPSAADGWQKARTDLYLQAQGILAADGQSALGHYWYQTAITLHQDDVRGTRILFPGLFNEVWLYVNGTFVAHRDYREPWWLTDYGFDWDVDLEGELLPGVNVIALRGFNPHHLGGMFRRPFLYRRVNGHTRANGNGVQ